MQDRVAQAIQSLKQSKSQSLSFFDAKQNLLSQGFTEDEIDQAAAQFVYTEIDPVVTNSQTGDPTLNEAFAEGVVHQEAIDNVKQQLSHDMGRGIVGGITRSADKEVLESLEDKGPSSPIQHSETIDEKAARDDDLRNAKDNLHEDSWLQLLPIVGIYYRFKTAKDIGDYESLKTGYSQTKVTMIWILIIVVMLFISLGIPAMMSNFAFFEKHSTFAKPFPFLGPIVAIILFQYVYPKKKD